MTPLDDATLAAIYDLLVGLTIAIAVVLAYTLVKLAAGEINHLRGKR